MPLQRASACASKMSGGSTFITLLMLSLTACVSKPSKSSFVATPSRFLVGLFLRNISNENFGVVLQVPRERRERD